MQGVSDRQEMCLIASAMVPDTHLSWEHGPRTHFLWSPNKSIQFSSSLLLFVYLANHPKYG